MVEQIDSIFDYVVVGGGLAGRAVVARLSENPDVRVILIEAGDENRYSAPLIRYLLTEQREREHDRFLRIVRMNAVLIEQLTLMIEELQRQIADRKQAEETLRQAQDKIFDAFFTTKTEGTGMGLRICRSIVESHGGHLWAVDNLPRGARFYFTLPVRH